MDAIVNTVTPVTDSSGGVYVGGFFSSCNGTGVNGLVQLNADGSIDTGCTVGTGMDSILHTGMPATDGSGDVFMEGAVTTYNVTGGGSSQPDPR